MKTILLSILAIATLSTASTSPCSAQSLKPEAPSPLQSGINQGTVDNMVGTHYWYFMGGPGKVQVHCQFKSMGMLGNPYKTDCTFTLYSASAGWRTPKVLESIDKAAEYTFAGDFKKEEKVMLSVAPPPNGLVRTGGDYQIAVSGAVAFGHAGDSDPVIGVYKEMSGYTTDLGDCKFKSDGNIETTSGATGNWKCFDKDSKTYVIDVAGQDRHTLQFVPGRGLCDNGTLVFQLVR